MQKVACVGSEVQKWNWGTYDEMAVAMAVDLVGYLYWAASVFSNVDSAVLRGLQGPDGVVVFWVFEQLGGG